MIKSLILALVLLQGQDNPPATINTPIVVRPTDIDEKGHVNNARFVEYLQFGRWEWLDQQGFKRQRLDELDTVLVVVNVNLNYRSEVRYGETVTVRTWPEKIGAKSFVFHQEVLKADGTEAASGTVTMVAIDPRIRKSRELPAELAKVLNQAIDNLKD